MKSPAEVTTTDLHTVVLNFKLPYSIYPTKILNVYMNYYGSESKISLLTVTRYNFWVDLVG